MDISNVCGGGKWKPLRFCKLVICMTNIFSARVEFNSTIILVGHQVTDIIVSMFFVAGRRPGNKLSGSYTAQNRWQFVVVIRGECCDSINSAAYTKIDIISYVHYKQS